MSVLGEVLDAVRHGVAAERLGPYLGIDPGLADAALDHWVRLGIVTPAGDLSLGCTSCTPSSAPAERAPSCAGCPFSGPSR